MRSIFYLVFGAVAIPNIFAQTVEVRGEGDLAKCGSYAWFKHEKIPIFDPIYTPDQPEIEQNLEVIDRTLREVVDQKLAKRGWKLVPFEEASCVLRYSILQEMDVDISPYGQGSAPPTSTTGFGENVDSGFASDVKRKGTMTIEVLPSGSTDWIWMGTIRDKIGKAKDVGKRSKKWAEKIADKIPVIQAN